MPRVRSIDTRQYRDLFLKLNKLAGSSEDDNFLIQLYDRSQTPQGYLTAVRSYRPKSLQVYFFKKNCPNIPNSLLALFLDVSPASVSIVGTARDVYSSNNNHLMNLSQYEDFRESDWKETRVAYAMASCLGYTGVSEENNNLPQLRQPRSSSGNTSMLQEMNPMAFSRLKMAITSGFEDGYEAREGDRGEVEYPRLNEGLRVDDSNTTEEVVETGQDEREQTELQEIQRIEEDNSTTVEEEVVTVQGSQGPREFTVTDASVRNSSNTFYYIGYQNANSGSLYNRSSEIKKFPITTSDDKVNVFYFAMLDEETDDRTGEAMDLVYYYQLQWGNTRVDGGAENQEQITTVAQLQSYFKNNTSRLSTPDTLNLFRLNGVDANTQTTIEALSKKAQSFELLPSVAPTYFTSTPNGSTQFNLRSDEKIVSVNRMFKQILGSIDTLRASRQATVSNTPLLTNAKLKTLAKKTYSKPFGLEIEGFDRFNTRLSFTKGMRERGNKIYATIAYKSKIPINGEEPYVDDAIWRVEADTSVRGADARGGSSDRSGVQNTMEIVSVILNQEENNSWIKPLEHFLTSAQAEGFLIDPSAGTHVHCGFALYDARQTANLFINTTLIRPVLLGLVSEAWKDRYYAMSRDISLDVLKEVNTLGNTNTQRDVVREYSGAQGQNRYSLMSLQNFPNGQSPTFEYRFQQSSVEKDTVINTVKILQRIWLASMKGVIPIKKGSGKSQDIVIKDLLGEDLYTYARNRYAETSLAPVRRGSTSSDNAFMGYNFPMGANEI